MYVNGEPELNTLPYYAKSLSLYFYTSPILTQLYMQLKDFINATNYSKLMDLARINLLNAYKLRSFCKTCYATSISSTNILFPANTYLPEIKLDGDTFY